MAKEEVRVKLSAEFEAKGVKSGADQVQTALAKTEKAFEKTELASKSFQKSLEKTEVSSKGFSKALAKIKAPKGIKGISKSIGKAGLAGAMVLGTAATAGLAAGVGAAAVGVVKLGRASKQSYESMLKYKSGLDSIKHATSGTNEQMSRLESIIGDLSTRTGESVGNVSHYVSQFTALGVGQKEATEAVVASLNVAKTKGLETNQVVTALMGAYRGSAEQASMLGINVQGLTKEQLKSGEAVDRIQEAYGKTLNTAAQLTKAEQETNKNLLEAEKIKAKMWTQAKGLKETWGLIKLAISKIKVAALRLMQPMVKHLNTAVKMALDLRSTMKLTGLLMRSLYLGVIADIARAMADLYRGIPGWIDTTARGLGISFEAIAQSFDESALGFEATSQRLKGDAKELLELIKESHSDLGQVPSGGGGTGGLSDKDTRVFDTKDKKDKELDLSKLGKFADRHMKNLLRIIKRREEAARRERERARKREERENEAFRKKMLDIYDKNIESFVEGDKEFQKKMNEEFNQHVIKTVEEAYKNLPVLDWVKVELKKNLFDPLFGLQDEIKKIGGASKFIEKKFSDAAKGILGSVGRTVRDLPGNAKEALKKLPKMILDSAVKSAASITAPSEIAAIDQSTDEGKRKALEATKANIDIGMGQAEDITGNVLDMLIPGLGSIFDILLQDPEKLSAFFDNLAAGFSVMIEKLSQNIGPIINAVVKNVPRIIKAVVKALPELNKALWDVLPEAVGVLIEEIVKALPSIIWSLVLQIGLAFQIIIFELPKLIAHAFRGVASGIAGLFGGGGDPAGGETYDAAGLAQPPQSLESYNKLGADIKALGDSKGSDDDDNDDRDRDSPRIAPITIGGVERTDQTLTAAEAFNPYINQDFNKEAKQPVKIEIQIGDQRLREIITDLQETGYPTVLTA